MDKSDHIDGQARDGLIRQLLGWTAERPRTYAEAMEAWPSSCSALSIWEDALAERLIEVQGAPGERTGAARVRLTEAGQARLAATR
jgi:hypothetical protein